MLVPMQLECTSRHRLIIETTNLVAVAVLLEEEASAGSCALTFAVADGTLRTCISASCCRSSSILRIRKTVRTAICERNLPVMDT